MKKNKSLEDLVKISRKFGSDPEYVLAGGGNTSFKDGHSIWVKASGYALAKVTKNSFVALDRGALRKIMEKGYPQEPSLREERVKEDLLRTRLYPKTGLRPSVESNFHELMDYPWVVHLHPWMVNTLTCSLEGEEFSKKILGEQVLWINYSDPGYTLAQKISQQITCYKKRYKKSPQIVLLQNHGLIVGGDTPREVEEKIKEVGAKIRAHLGKDLKGVPKLLPIPPTVDSYPFPLWIRKGLGPQRRRIIYGLRLSSSEDAILIKQGTLSPDQIVYCRLSPVWFEYKAGENQAKIKERLTSQIAKYIDTNGYEPKIVVINRRGGSSGDKIAVFGIGEFLAAAKNSGYLLGDALKVIRASHPFGGPKFLSKKESNFIDNWEVEAYRRRLAQTPVGKVSGRIAIVTGAGQGVGKGIAYRLAQEGAQVVIADLNYKSARQVASSIEKDYGEGKALPFKVDVRKEKEVEKMVQGTLEKYGGIDILINNAGILISASCLELSYKDFLRVMDINCNAYFLCAQKVAQVMKEQGYGDIIQINSKSGKKGSKANSAYSASKFAGIALTQSLAMDLAPYNIYVNAICPGNFLDLELWERKGGLLDQYLKAGKVLGARNREEVKDYYKSLTLLKRGCTIEDIMPTIFYILEQRGETGQAYNVTQGQEMR